MQDPYCPDCGIVNDLHSGIYCRRMKEDKAKYERNLELVREMNKILHREIDELELLNEIADKLIAKLVTGADYLLRDLDCVDAGTLSRAKTEAQKWLGRNGCPTDKDSLTVEAPTSGDNA